MRINVYVDKSQLNSNKEMTVFLVFRDITGKRAMLHTGMYSPVAFKGREFPSSVPNARQKTSALNKLIVFVEDIALANPELTAPELKDKIGNLIFGRKSKLSLLLTDYIKIYIEEKVYSQGTKGLYISTIRKIEEFDPEATLDTVDLEWLTRFEKHCKNTMSINGMAIPMRNIRSVFNWALKNRKTQNYPFLFYKIKSEETKKRSATVEQLRKLRDYPCRNAQIAEYRDLFFLMFYLLGINAVDLFLAKKGQVVNGRFEYRRAKTHKLYSIKLEPEAEAIIKRYRGNVYLLNVCERYSSYHDYLHHMNHALGLIGRPYSEGKGYEKDTEAIIPGLTSYFARHSWATIASSLDISHDVISAGLGHRIMNPTTAIYINFNQEKVDVANRKVIDFLNEDQKPSAKRKKKKNKKD